MASFLDTSFVLRYIAGDDPAMLRRSKEVIESDESLIITDAVLMEAAFVLASVYKTQRENIVDLLVGLIQKENISVYGINKGVVLKALLMCRPSGRVSVTDALTWATAISAGVGIYTFDKRFPSEGLEILN